MIAATPATADAARRRPAGRRPTAATAGRAAAIALVAGLTAWLSFRSGGYFAGSTALATIALVLATLLVVMLPDRPLAHVSPAGAVSMGALLLLTVWTLASGEWSGAPARTLNEYQRALLYLLAFSLFASLGGALGNARWLLRTVAVTLGGATLVGLAARLDPALGEALSAPADERLSWPVGYWNALGLAGSLALIACVHMSSDLDEPRPARVLAAAAVPALAVAVLLTLSRGAVVAGAIGVVALLLLARGRGTPSALVAIVPFTVHAVLEAYGATALTDDVAGDVASQRAGADLARTVAGAVLGAAIVRTLGLILDARLSRARLWRPLSSRQSAAMVLAVVLATLAGGYALGAPETISRQYQSFLDSELEPVEEERDRLRQASANGRLEHWEVALQVWRTEPLRGQGAGTYARDWARLRPTPFAVQDAHSLYLEVLAELGVIGLLLLAVALVAALVAMVLRRRENRVAWSAVLAVYLTWLIHAGIDWDWEMPALTLPVFALAGAACARSRPRAVGAGRQRSALRLIAGLGVLLLLLTPARIAMSQRHLELALTAFRQDRCGAAIDHALAAVDALDEHPAAFELLGFCDVRLGRRELGIRMLEAAVRREPRSWELHYGLALVRGAAGRDPRPALRRARRLNPMEPRVLTALERLDSDRPRVWRRAAAKLPLIVPGG